MSQVTEPTKDVPGSPARAIRAAVAIAFILALLFTIWFITGWLAPWWLWMCLAGIIFMAVVKPTAELMPKVPGKRVLVSAAAVAAIAFAWALVFTIWFITGWLAPWWLWIGLAVMIIFIAAANMPDEPVCRRPPNGP